MFPHVRPAEEVDTEDVLTYNNFILCLVSYRKASLFDIPQRAPLLASNMVAKQEPTHPQAAWTDVVATKRASRDQQIKKYNDELQDTELVAKITEIDDVETLQELLKNGDISAEAVIKAYIDKCVLRVGYSSI